MTTPELLLSALLTYLVHSTVLTVSAWLVTRGSYTGDPRLRRGLWRAALLGGVLTTAVQTGFSVEPLAGGLHLGSPLQPAVSAEATLVTTDVLPVVPPRALGESALHLRASLVRIALGLWLTGVVLVALRLGHAYLRFRRCLGDRRDVTDVGLRACLREVLESSGVSFDVRLTSSHSLTVPIAFGLRRAEICVPARIVKDLDAAQQRALLAHELAHLVHRDPLWLAFYSAASTLFFFQPLNWLARRRLLSLSESAADRWAVQTVADPLALASCLTQVASWMRPNTVRLLAHAMASGRSDLAQRVAHVLDDDCLRVSRGSIVKPALVMLLILSAVTLVAPGISLADKATAPPEPEETAEPVSAPIPPRTLVPPTPPVTARAARVPEPPRAADAPLAPRAPRAPRAAAAPEAASAPRAPREPAPPPRAALVPPPPEFEGLENASEAALAIRLQTIESQNRVEAARLAAEDMRAQVQQLKRASADQRDALKRDAAAQAAQLKMQADVLRRSADTHAHALDAERAALDDARRQLEATAQGLRAERQRLDQERRHLDEETERLREETERVRQEREKARGQS
jgi:beta-lactamase regulating signal transducer with metallopeptidase domain